ncbi:MAG: Isoprenylcysteine carboxyl methyltransferase (ICMT) family protein [Methanocella sp. PtaU1.Bin125]|nr:MAG: Isoprenylcysteine carboxyl methyltransferase (ICMT) family protein [Methanocella sp. PtaU1.Bin125]
MKFDTLREDWLFIVPATIVWATAIAAIAMDFIFLQKMAYRFDLASAAGLAMMAFGLALRLWARRAIGRAFTYALQVRPDQALAEQGPYRYIRHPGYTGDLLFHFGIAVTFHSLYGFAIMLLLIPCFIYRMGIEETMLTVWFGDRYRRYIERTKRLVPLVY